MPPGNWELVRVSQTSQSDFESMCPDEHVCSPRGHGGKRWDWRVGEREERVGVRAIRLR